MALVKCPRCELNYMDSTEKFCKVCYRDIHGHDQREEPEICTVCNEAPCLPGKDMCLFCLKEMTGSETQEGVETPVEVEIDSVSTMDEIVPGIHTDISDPEYREMDKDLSLEEMEEKEEDMEDDQDDEDA